MPGTPKHSPAYRRSPALRRRYRMVRLSDGSEVAERIDGDEARRLVYADLYGGQPMLSTGAYMRPVQSVLAEIVSNLKLEQEADIAPELLDQAWLSAVGDFLATQARLLRIDRGQALIATGHPAVRYELTRHKQHIVRALNAALGEGCIRAIRIIQG